MSDPILQFITGPQMLEDEQILLQNLSFELTAPTHSDPTPSTHLHPFYEQKQQGGRVYGLITQKKSPRKFYIDWNQADNYHYFTKNEQEQVDESPLIENPPKMHENTTQEEGPVDKDYWQINHRLQMALNLIKSAKKRQHDRFFEKRSQSNEPHKEREVRGLARTVCGFRGTESKQRKNSEHSRLKTESEEEGAFRENPFKLARLQKYQANLSIAQQLEQVDIKEACKENNLRNKFLTSMAQWQQKKERRIQERIQKEFRLTMEGVTFTPQINPKSREIMKKKGTIAPIYQRQHRDKKRQLTERFNIEQKAHRAFKPPPL